MEHPVFYLLVSIGTLVTITGIILFTIGVGADQSSKIQVFGANFENKGSSIIIFLVGAIFILIGVVYYNPSFDITSNDLEHVPEQVDQKLPENFSTTENTVPTIDSKSQVTPINLIDTTVQETSTP